MHGKNPLQPLWSSEASISRSIAAPVGTGKAILPKKTSVLIILNQNNDSYEKSLSLSVVEFCSFFL